MTKASMNFVGSLNKADFAVLMALISSEDRVHAMNTFEKVFDAFVADSGWVTPMATREGFDIVELDIMFNTPHWQSLRDCYKVSILKDILSRV